MKRSYLALTLLTSWLCTAHTTTPILNCACQESCLCIHKNDGSCACVQKNGNCSCAEHHAKNKNIDTDTILAEVAYGELLDKITILEIKSTHIKDAQKLHNIWKELTTLNEAFEQIMRSFPQHMDTVLALKAQLYDVNQQLWDIEDALREKEAFKTFDNAFTELARSVYKTNDMRCALKRELNMLLNSPLIEEKSYKAY